MDKLTEPIRTLVVDDTAFMRKALINIFEKDGDIEVVGVAKNGKDALEAVRELEPHVVTLDIDMPVMDGLTAMKHIMIETPTPVVMISSLADHGEVTLDALRLGAVDFFPKPSGTISLDIEHQADELKHIVKTASKIDPLFIKRVRLNQETGHSFIHMKQPQNALGVVILVTPKGFSGYLLRLLVNLRTDMPIAILALHDISKKAINSCIDRFNSFVPWNVVSDGKGLLMSGDCVFHSFNDLFSLEKDADDNFYIGESFDGNVLSMIDQIVKNFQKRCIILFFGDDLGAELNIFNDIAKKESMSSEVNFCYDNLDERALMHLGMSRRQGKNISEAAIWSAIKTFGHECLLDFLSRETKF